MGIYMASGRYTSFDISLINHSSIIHLFIFTLNSEYVLLAPNFVYFFFFVNIELLKKNKFTVVSLVIHILKLCSKLYCCTYRV